MRKLKRQQFFKSMAIADARLRSLSPKEKVQLEKTWDVEHAYYSSVLEGSLLDREEFEQLAKKVA